LLGTSVEKAAMKPSSISLWSIGLLGAVALPLSGAEAGWRDRVIVEDGWYEVPYPPAYVRRRPVEVYRAPRYFRGPLVYGRRGELVYVDPDQSYGDPDDEYVDPYDMMPDESYQPDPYRRPDTMAPPKPRTRGQAALPGRRAVEEGEPTVVPGIAPTGRPRTAAAKPGTIDPGKAAPGPAKATPRVAEAQVALPVKRPNLEGLDFAPSAPALQDPSTSEDRR
jgi:hypothetical protein